MAQAVTWADVLACFADRLSPTSVVHRLAAEWATRYGVVYEPIGPHSRVRREIWTHRQIGAHIDRLAAVVPALAANVPAPRRDGGALVLIDFGGGRIGQIDGRRRANVWRHTPGRYPVLIVEATCGS